MIARIKTEKEFIKEFGSNWKTSVYQSFPPSMDTFLGIPFMLSVDEHKSLIKERFIELNTKFNPRGWNFSLDMMILDPWPSRFIINKSFDLGERSITFSSKICLNTNLSTLHKGFVFIKDNTFDATIVYRLKYLRPEYHSIQTHNGDESLLNFYNFLQHLIKKDIILEF